MKKIYTFAELQVIAAREPIFKAIMDDRVQDVAEGRTSRWTRRRPGGFGFEIKPREQGK